jgi:hypothetical protein
MRQCHDTFYEPFQDQGNVLVRMSISNDGLVITQQLLLADPSPKEQSNKPGYVIWNPPILVTK